MHHGVPSGSSGSGSSPRMSLTASIPSAKAVWASWGVSIRSPTAHTPASPVRHRPSTSTKPRPSTAAPVVSRPSEPLRGRRPTETTTASTSAVWPSP